MFKCPGRLPIPAQRSQEGGISQDAKAGEYAVPEITVTGQGAEQSIGITVAKRNKAVQGGYEEEGILHYFGMQVQALHQPGGMGCGEEEVYG